MKTSTIIFALFLSFAVQSVFADRILENQATVDAPLREVWSAWTTNEGFSSWAVAKAEIDLRIGGEIRTSYNAQSNLHDEHTIVNRILSFEPQRMLSISNVQAPAGFKNADLFQMTWTVIYFDSIAPERTHVRIIGMGYGEGPDWDDIYNKFKAGNQWTLDKLREKFSRQATSSPDDTAEVMKLLTSFVGGDWIHENARSDGRIFRARNCMELGPNGHTICAKGWLGDGGGMTPHSALQIWREPAATSGGQPGAVRFQNIGERGSIARGEIHLTAPNQLEWDWLATELYGRTTRYHIITTVQDADHYRFVLTLPSEDSVSGGAAKELVNIVYTRVRELPAAFQKMKGL